MFEHETVLKWESIKGLNIKPDGIYVDCTLGGAGHSEEIVKQLTTGHLYAFDRMMSHWHMQQNVSRRMKVALL